MTVSLVPSVLRRLAGGHRHAQGGLPALSWFPLANSRASSSQSIQERLQDRSSIHLSEDNY